MKQSSFDMSLHLDLQLGLRYPVVGDNDLPRRSLLLLHGEDNDSVAHLSDFSTEKALIVDRLSHDDPDHLPDAPLHVIQGLQGPVETGRRNLQGIGLSDQVLDVQIAFEPPAES